MRIQRIARWGLIATAAAVLTACVTPPQQPVALAPETLAAAPSLRIGVMMSAVPKADTSFPGAGCLLCLATANVMHSSLNEHVKTLPSSDLDKLKAQTIQLLRKRGAQVVEISDTFNPEALPDAKAEGPNLARKDFTALGKKHGVDKLVVIELEFVGITRQFSSYVPTAVPKATVRGRTFMVNTSSNGYDWYMPLNVEKAADGEWDEAPKFPGLTNAYYQSLELAKDSVTSPLRN